MELNFDGQYEDYYKKHYKEIITSFCEHKKVGEIAKELNAEYEEKITFQALNYFYYNNKKVIDDCIKDKENKDLEQIKAETLLEYLKDIGKETLYYISLDLRKKIEDLTYEQQVKLIPTLINALAKCEGMDKSEIKLNQIDLSSIFGDNLEWD